MRSMNAIPNTVCNLGAVDTVIPVYRESPEALAATLAACLNQSYPISRIVIVDDGSPVPVTVPAEISSTNKVRTVRLERNQGIASARNAGIRETDAPFIACINSEVLPSPDWLQTCIDYLSAHVQAGACYARMVPDRPLRLLTRWRMRFQEQKYGDVSGPARFAPGHAVLFRSEAIESVQGYDARFRRIDEDFNICDRMRRAGWETHYVAESQCVSIQLDTLRSLANKQLLRSDWQSPADYPLPTVFLDQSKWLVVRLTRNIGTGRLLFAPVDIAITGCALGIAIARTLAHKNSKSLGEVEPTGP